MRLAGSVGIARQNEYPKNHSTLGVEPSDQSQRWELPAGRERVPCDGRLVADGAGSPVAAPGLGVAIVARGRPEAATLSVAALPSGLGVSSARIAGTITIAIANAAINRTADLMVPPESRLPGDEAGRTSPLRLNLVRTSFRNKRAGYGAGTLITVF